jgi:hypothetical protein
VSSDDDTTQAPPRPDSGEGHPPSAAPRLGRPSFAEADRQLFLWLLIFLIERRAPDVRGCALLLDQLGQIEPRGIAGQESRVKRLARRFRKYVKANKLAAHCRHPLLRALLR